MKYGFVRTAAAAAAAALFLTSAVYAAAPENAARRAILADGVSGRVLYEKSADERSLIASTTKIMTGLLICENCDLNAEFSIPAEAVGVEGSSLYLTQGEVCSVRELLYGMMLRSGNDAATALAIFCDGSIERFVARMNMRARELGLWGTHFENPSGLDAQEHYSTARDLAKLACAAMKNQTFHEVVSTKSVTIGSRTMTNHNKLLWRYDGASGIKTGYTRAAGRVLVSCAERDGRRLIAVTIDDPDDWNDHAALLDYGFDAFEARKVAVAGQTLAQLPVISGEQASVELVAGDTLVLPLLPEETIEIRILAPQMVFAPVLAGQAGTAEVWCGGERLGEIPLYYRQPVAQVTAQRRFRRIFGG